MTTQLATITIQNLKCHGCANTIAAQLSKLEAVSDVKVDNETNSVSFNYNDETAYKAAIDKLSSLGYPVAGENNAFHTKAKSLVSCAIGRMNT
ncbi:heavy-metal-associated domain-containing protein [Paucihalobacter sp.]|uniref:heavy-metal-associated domain-containing protein n=1 Tax=Paucihalobacter sp. TaxID=2850405 RepID=UPI002FE073B8